MDLKTHKFEHVYQGDNTKLCGQAVVASILDISLEESVKLIGHSDGTKTKEIVKALKITGRRKRGPLSDLCIISVKFPNTRDWHWALKEGDVISDPAIPFKVDLDRYLYHLSSNDRRVTSSIDLTPYYKPVKEPSNENKHA